MSAHSIPVLSGFRQSVVTLDGSDPVRAWLAASGRPGAGAAVVPHADLLNMIGQQPLLRLTFLSNGAVLTHVTRGWMEPLPLVFLEGVGLNAPTSAGQSCRSPKPQSCPSRLNPFVRS